MCLCVCVVYVSVCVVCVCVCFVCLCVVCVGVVCFFVAQSNLLYQLGYFHYICYESYASGFHFSNILSLFATISKNHVVETRQTGLKFITGIQRS